VAVILSVAEGFVNVQGIAYFAVKFFPCCEGREEVARRRQSQPAEGWKTKKPIPAARNAAGIGHPEEVSRFE
jgi:hypothetical protein